MPKKSSKKPRRSRRDNIKRLFVFISIIAITWGVWTMFDHFLLLKETPLLGPAVAIIAALAFLLWDDFHLKELE